MKYTKESEWSDMEFSLLKQMYPNSLKQDLIASFPTKTWAQIKGKAGKNKIKLSRKNNSGDFSILLDGSNISIYWIGFLCADGHFTDRGSISLELSAKDLNHLLKFAEYVGADESSLYKRDRLLKGKLYSMASLTIGHLEVVKKLKRAYKIQAQKSKNPVKISHLTDLQKMCFFIGFIDGDGSISMRKDLHTILSIEIDQAWLPILQEFKILLDKFEFTNAANAVLYQRKDTGQTFARWQTTKATCLTSIKELALSNSLPIMERKWNKV